MPRQSADARAAAVFRAGGHRPPPRGLPPRARALWREIVGCRAPDHFDPGSFPLLRQFCILAAHTETLEAELAVDAHALEEMLAVARTMTTLATKLRLTVQSRVRYDAGALDERLPDPTTPVSRLLGGRALRVVKGDDAS